MPKMLVKPTKEWLRQQYILEGLTARQIGQLLGISKTPVLRLLHNFEIPLRRSGSRGLKGMIHPKWKGGIKINSNGVYIRLDAGTPNARYEKLARVIMAHHIGRELTSKEVVHHRNGDKADNRIKNLLLLANQSEHAKLHNPEMEKRRWQK